MSLAPPNFYGLAVGEFYATDDSDDAIVDEDDLTQALTEDGFCAWEPFEDYDFEWMSSHIDDLATRFEDTYYLGKRDAILEAHNNFKVDTSNEPTYFKEGDYVWFENHNTRTNSGVYRIDRIPPNDVILVLSAFDSDEIMALRHEITKLIRL